MEKENFIYKSIKFHYRTYVNDINDDYSFLGNNQVPNFGWNLGAPASVSMPQPPAPSYHHHSQNDDSSSEPGVEEENFSTKSAGAMSFAHYIVEWVSNFLHAHYLHTLFSRTHFINIKIRIRHNIECISAMTKNIKNKVVNPRGART